MSSDGAARYTPRMFFFVFGAKPRFSNAEPPERRALSCPLCLGTRSFDRKRARTWLEFFFLPVIPVGAARDVFVCASCGMALDAAAADARSTTMPPPAADDGANERLHCLHCGAELLRPRHPGWRTLRCDACGRSFEARVD
ncbi:MAG: zinc-ribbon domain-containing protein, partial [Candidatus Eisenbacteria bacterium]